MTTLTAPRPSIETGAGGWMCCVTGRLGRDEQKRKFKENYKWMFWLTAHPASAPARTRCDRQSFPWNTNQNRLFYFIHKESLWFRHKGAFFTLLRKKILSKENLTPRSSEKACEEFCSNHVTIIGTTALNIANAISSFSPTRLAQPYFPSVSHPSSPNSHISSF